MCTISKFIYSLSHKTTNARENFWNVYRFATVVTRTFFALGVSPFSVTPGDYVMTICFSST